MDSINQPMDTSSTRTKTAIIGIGRDKLQIPNELMKVGRLEKEIQMIPPSQNQREAMLYHLLIGLKVYASTNIQPEFEECCKKWADLLASVTAGCIASDLCRICSDAWCNRLSRFDTIDNYNSNDANQTHWPVTWNDLSESVRSITPSQLAMLDVTKPMDCLDLCSVDDWIRIHEISWNNFAGYDAMKRRVYRTVVVPWRRHIKNPIDSSNAQPGTIIPPSGILFHGPSGCGKTLAANCLGSSLGLPMIKVRAVDVLDKWLGGSEAVLRSLFTRARSAAPCILFFDEIDAIASNRANSDGVTADVMSRLLSTLLNEMDGISSSHQSNVVVLACTNRLESLDAALLRPGRLEEHIHLSFPTQDDTYSILQQKLALAPSHTSIDLNQIAYRLIHQSACGADIDGICREAVFRAIRRCSDNDYSNISVTEQDLEDGMVAIKLDRHK